MFVSCSLSVPDASAAINTHIPHDVFSVGLRLTYLPRSKLAFQTTFMSSGTTHLSTCLLDFLGQPQEVDRVLPNGRSGVVDQTKTSESFKELAQNDSYGDNKNFTTSSVTCQHDCSLAQPEASGKPPSAGTDGRLETQS